MGRTNTRSLSGSCWALAIFAPTGLCCPARNDALDDRIYLQYLIHFRPWSRAFAGSRLRRHECAAKLAAGQRALFSLSRSVTAKLEKLHRIVTSDLAPVRLADRAGVEPARGMVDILERPVGGKHDA